MGRKCSNGRDAQTGINAIDVWPIKHVAVGRHQQQGSCEANIARRSWLSTMGGSGRDRPGLRCADDTPFVHGFTVLSRCNTYDLFESSIEGGLSLVTDL